MRAETPHAHAEVPAACGAMHNAVSSRHRSWRAQGRLVYLCGSSPALGAYIKTIFKAFGFAMQMQRALILSCDATHPSYDTVRSVGEYFRPTAMNWRPPPGSSMGDVITVHIPWKSAPIADELLASPTHAFGIFVGNASVALHVNEHAPNVGPFATDAHCVLRLLFAPSPALIALARQFASVDVFARHTRGDARKFSALHVRLGDGNMASEGWKANHTRRDWSFLFEQRHIERGFRRDDPGSTFLACYRAMLPPPHVVVADTQSVVETAQRLGMHTTSTLGRPANFGMHGSYGAGDSRKAFVDWLLLATAETVVAVGFKTSYSEGGDDFYVPRGERLMSWSSNFIATARAWRGADEPATRLVCAPGGPADVEADRARGFDLTTEAMRYTPHRVCPVGSCRREL